MRTQYYTASSLDGFLATEGHSLEWLFPLVDINATGYNQFIQKVGSLAMGSSTYEWMLRHVVNAPGGPAPWPYAMPTWVFTSRKLPSVTGADIRFVQGDVRPVHAAMRAATPEGRNIWLVGGGELVGQFFDAGLLDDLIVQVGSVTLGSGHPLLPRRIALPRRLELEDVKRFGPGMAELRYRVLHDETSKDQQP